jgi:hypothetical protein
MFHPAAPAPGRAAPPSRPDTSRRRCPTAAAKPSASRSESSPTKTGQPARSAITTAAPMPARSPRSPPSRQSSDRLHQELVAHVAPARAEGEPQPDLAGALGDRDQHDVHDRDAADDERDRGDRGKQPGEGARRGVLQRHRLGRVGDGEVVGLIRGAAGGAGAAAWRCRPTPRASAASEAALTRM